MISQNEVLVIQEMAIFSDFNNINKSAIARRIGVSQKTVRNIIKKLKEYKENVKQ